MKMLRASQLHTFCLVLKLCIRCGVLYVITQSGYEEVEKRPEYNDHLLTAQKIYESCVNRIIHS